MSNIITVIASSNIDMVTKADRIPVPGETVLGGEFLSAHSGNKGNDYRSGKSYGQCTKLEFRIPHDRYGNFHPQIPAILPDREDERYSLAGVLYTRGLAQGQEGDVYAQIYGEHYSKSSISRMIECVRAQVSQWLERSIESYYPIVFVDCVHIKIHRKRSMSSGAFYVALTVTEDFFNTSWCPIEPFSHQYFGYPRVNNDIGWLGRTHVYRFFINDPIFFEKGVKGTIETGHNNNLTLDLSTVAYWYQDKAIMLPPAPSKEQRKPKSFINYKDIHRWRDAWRKAKGNNPQLWGNEW